MGSRLNQVSIYSLHLRPQASNHLPHQQNVNNKMHALAVASHTSMSPSCGWKGFPAIAYPKVMAIYCFECWMDCRLEAHPTCGGWQATAHQGYILFHGPPLRASQATSAGAPPPTATTGPDTMDVDLGQHPAGPFMKHSSTGEHLQSLPIGHAAGSRAEPPGRVGDSHPARNRISHQVTHVDGSAAQQAENMAGTSSPGAASITMQPQPACCNGLPWGRNTSTSDGAASQAALGLPSAAASGGQRDAQGQSEAPEGTASPSGAKSSGKPKDRDGWTDAMLSPVPMPSAAAPSQQPQHSSAPGVPHRLEIKLKCVPALPPFLQLFWLVVRTP